MELLELVAPDAAPCAPCSAHNRTTILRKVSAVLFALSALFSAT